MSADKSDWADARRFRYLLTLYGYLFKEFINEELPSCSLNEEQAEEARLSIDNEMVGYAEDMANTRKCVSDDGGGLNEY